jgi:hypothetical protein
MPEALSQAQAIAFKNCEIKIGFDTYCAFERIRYGDKAKV